jgi:hypothetical protein
MNHRRSTGSLHGGGSALQSDVVNDLTMKPSWMYDLPQGGSELSNDHHQYNLNQLSKSTNFHRRTITTSSQLSNAGYAAMYNNRHRLSHSSLSSLSRRHQSLSSITSIDPRDSMTPMTAVTRVHMGHPYQRSLPYDGSSTYNTSTVTMTSDGPRIDFPYDAYGVRNPTSGVVSIDDIQNELPSEWVAVTSSQNSQTFFYNTRTERVSWARPFREEYPAPPPPPPPPPKICHHGRCKGSDFCFEIGPQLPTDNDLLNRNMSHDLVSIDFGTALMKFGPKVLLYKILMANVLHCFETWHVNALKSREDRELLEFNSAALIQAHWRRMMVEAAMIERIREYKKRLKCYDFPDIRNELKEMVSNMSEDTRNWYLPFTANYLKRVIGHSKSKTKPKKCLNSIDNGCIQPAYLTQENGYCQRCNYFKRFPEKAALQRVMEQFN